MARSVHLYLRLLGRFEIASDPEFAAPIRLSGRKLGALVAFLAMRPDMAASREVLASLLWGGCSDRQARHSLRQALVSLRQRLNRLDAFSAEPDVIRLRPDAWRVDARCFEEWSKSPQAEDLLSAARLFRGDFLGGFRLDEESFEEWAQGQRQRIQAAAVRLCETLLAMPDPAASGEAAIPVIEQLIGIDPLREDWQRLALRLYARGRGRHEALAQARMFKAVLRRELDVDPEPATVALIEEIERDGDGPPPAALPAAGSQLDAGSVRPVQAIATTAPRRRATRAGLAAAAAVAAAITLSGALLIGLRGPPVPPHAADRAKNEGFQAPPIDQLLAAAAAAGQRNNTTEALRLFEEALRRQPDDPHALVGVAAQLVAGGTSYLLERKAGFDRAEQLLNRALEIKPDWAPAHHWLGIIQRVHRLDFEASLRSLMRALELDPGSASSSAHVGRTLAMMGRWEEALAHLDKAMRLGPEHQAMSRWLFFAGEAQLELGNYGAARDLLRRSLALSPRNPRVHGSLAATYALMGDAAGAAAHIAQVKELSQTKSLTNLVEDSRGRGRAQRRLVEGLRLALAGNETGGIPARGTTRRRFSNAGQDVLIASHSSLDDQCRHNGFPVVKVLSPPAHGAIDIRELSVIVGGQRGHIGGTCDGVRNMGLGVYYRSRPGFHGSDRVTYRVAFPSSIYFDDTVEIMIFPEPPGPLAKKQ